MSISGILTYEISGLFINILPIINTDNSFLVLNSSINNNTVTVEYEYDEIINNDGLYLYNFNDYEITKITSFGGIPLSRQGNQFRDYKGTFPDDLNDTPTILNDTTGRYMFSRTVFSSGVGNWNVENITNLERAFERNPNFNEDLNNWNLVNLSGRMSNIFESCSSFNGNVSNWNVENVNNIQFAFSGCSSFNQPLNWNVSNITDMIALFEICIVFNQNLNGWDMSNVKLPGRMFNGCNSFNQPVNNWITSNFNDINSMFGSCSIFNQDLSSWDVSNVINMRGLFQNSTIFNQDLSSWNIEQVISMFNMLDNSGLSVENYDNTLIGWTFQQIQPNVTLGALNLQYSSSGELARNFLINPETNNWTINGDTLICFMKNTMILILENGIEVERKVQELKNDDMVKISTGEYKKLVFIGTKTIDITKNIDKIIIMKQGILGNNLPNKDLLVTSGHSLLFNNLNYANEFYKSEFYDNNIEDYYKIMSQHCKLFDYVKEKELENIRDGDNVSYYHFCLENNDEEGQYGVYSNGVLSETMALSFSKKNYMNKN